jgi:hypothetical protein
MERIEMLKSTVKLLFCLAVVSCSQEQAPKHLPESDLNQRIRGSGYDPSQYAKLIERSKGGDAMASLDLAMIHARRKSNVAADDLFDNRVYYNLLASRQERNPISMSAAL